MAISVPGHHAAPTAVFRTFASRLGVADVG